MKISEGWRLFKYQAFLIPTYIYLNYVLKYLFEIPQLLYVFPFPDFVDFIIFIIIGYIFCFATFYKNKVILFLPESQSQISDQTDSATLANRKWALSWLKMLIHPTTDLSFNLREQLQDQARQIHWDLLPGKALTSQKFHNYKIL